MSGGSPGPSSWRGTAATSPQKSGGTSTVERLSVRFLGWMTVISTRRYVPGEPARVIRFG